jgi:hypothetical protein
MECDTDKDGTDDTEHHLQTALDSKDESDETCLTSIWSRRRSVRSPRHFEDYQ